MTTFEYTIKDDLGIHARPAGLLIKEASAHKCSISITKGEKRADAKKIFSVMGLGVKHGDTIKITCEGDGETEAAEKLRAFFYEYL